MKLKRALGTKYISLTGQKAQVITNVLHLAPWRGFETQNNDKLTETSLQVITIIK